MEMYVIRRRWYGLALLLCIVLLIGLFGYRRILEQRAAVSRITHIARELNGYRVYWAGGADLADIATYDVQVCELPCQGWRDWQMQVTETSAWFGPDEGKHFGFRVRARDQHGYTEPWPTRPGMDTRQAKQR